MAANDRKQYITQEGWEALNAELDELKTVRRREVSQRIKEAIALGDLSENSEFDDAKNEQAFLEGRIAEIENRLKLAEIVVSGSQNGRIGVGSTTVLKDNASGSEVKYMVTGSSEADPFLGKISNEPPIGAALMDKKEGDTIEVETPGGHRSFTVISIG